jgi:hypothetical protein
VASGDLSHVFISDRLKRDRAAQLCMALEAGDSVSLGRAAAPLHLLLHRRAASKPSHHVHVPFLPSSVVTRHLLLQEKPTQERGTISALQTPVPGESTGFR